MVYNLAVGRPTLAKTPSLSLFLACFVSGSTLFLAGIQHSFFSTRILRPILLISEDKPPTRMRFLFASAIAALAGVCQAQFVGHVGPTVPATSKMYECNVL